MNSNDSNITPFPGMPPQDASPEDQAEYWLVQLDAQPRDPQVQIAFVRWYDADPAHAEAYANAELLWQSFDLLAATAVEQTPAPQPETPEPEPSSERHSESSRSPGRWKGWALAACLLLSIGTGIGVGGWQIQQADLQPAMGSVQRYQLEDGSTLFADSESRIDLAFDESERLLYLKKGRLFVDVAKDGRPLMVVAGDSRITAMGTQFSVHRLGDGQDSVNVAVQESRVQVSVSGQQQDLKAGQQVWLTEDGLQAPQPLGKQQGLAWRKGLLVARNRPLELVLAELNRYHPDHLLILDAALAAEQINTVLNLQKPQQALVALLASLKLEQQVLGPVRLIQRP